MRAEDVVKISSKKNHLIKMTFFSTLITFVLVGANFLDKTFPLIFLVWLISQYMKNGNKDIFQDVFFYNKNFFSLLELNAGLIIFQIIIIVYTFLDKMPFLPSWIGLVLLFVVAIFAGLFEIEYRNGKKFILASKKIY